MSIAPDTSLVAGAVSAEEALCRIVEGTGATTGRDFFRSLVRHLAGALGMRWAFVGELVPVGDAGTESAGTELAGAGSAGIGGPPVDRSERVRTLAVWAGGDFAPDFEY